MKPNQINIPKEIVEGVVLVVKLGQQLEDKGDHFLLKTKLLKDRIIHPNISICVGNLDFFDMPTAFCQGSGFFIEQNVIATAAHVLLDATQYLDTNIQDIRFIKNFHIEDHTEISNTIRIEYEDVFQPKKGWEELKYFNYTSMSEDWALVPIDPVIEGVIPPPIKTSSKLNIEITGEYSWIGHPMGLPKIFHLPAKGIKDDPDESFFEISNVAYGGLSGAPVLKDGQIVGIVVRGNGQLTLDGENNCVKLFERPSLPPGSELFEGTECQRIEWIEDELNQLLLEIQEETPGTPLT